MEISLNINGRSETFIAFPTDNLRDALRAAGYYSARYGSDDGATGASAILVDGKLVNSTTMVVGQAVDHRIETVEGLTQHVGELHPIQKAFIETGAIQSGYATPAMILAAKALLDQNLNPSEADVRNALSGILCRETGYVKPVEAVLRAARYLRGEEVEPYDGPEIVDASYLVEMPPADDDGDADLAGPDAAAGGPQISTQTKSQTDM